MKTIETLVVLLFLFGGGAALGSNPDVVYIDHGLVGYCSSPEVKNAAVKFSLYDVNSGSTRTRFLPGSLFPTQRRDSSSYVARFPLAWSLADKKLSIIFPNLSLDAVGRVAFLIWTDKDVTDTTDNRYEAGVNSFHPQKAFTVDNGIVVYNEWHGRGAHLGLLSSQPFAVAPKEGTPQVAWYDLDNTSIVAQLPFAHAESSDWEPCVSPLFVRVTEMRLPQEREGVLYAASLRDAVSLNSQDIPPDGFMPVGSARTAGRRVLSDDPKAAFPNESDWLIWEKSGDACRMCQMRDGRRSVCKDAPRKDAPKTIVVNNDTKTVCVLYSLTIDSADVDGSLKRLVDYLRSLGALPPVENANIKDAA